MRKGLRICLSLLACSVPLIGAGPAFGNGPPVVEKTKLWSYFPEQGHTVKVQSEAGYCVGEPPPRVVKVASRPQGKVSGGRQRLVVTMWIERRAPISPQPQPPGVPELLCAGRGYRVKATVKTVPMASDVVVFDGFFEQPRRVRMAEKPF